ncbi:MAG: glycosyltransferase, partial [Alphaproteobacteria bacterium]|nr:glycosyltransferase [Alphaproteobacteria bacterium]
MSTSRKLTIAQIIPSLNAGGAERAAVDIAAATIAAGHRAIVISKGGYYQAELQAKHAKFVKRNADTKNPLLIIINAFWLAAFIKQEGVDIIHARSRAPAWSAYLATLMTGTPFVTTFHAAYKGNFFLKKMYNSVMAKGRRIIAISKFIAGHVQTNYGVPASRIAIVPRGIDMSIYDQASISDERKQKLQNLWNNQPDVPVMIMPGRLSPIKGHELVIEALAAIKDRPFICVFIGPDQGRSKYSEMLRKLVHENGLSDKIKWMDGGDIPA